jgi:small-conductance mechanosensitive channel
VLLGKAMLQHTLHPSLLNLAVPLLVSLALIRVSFYVLRHIFTPGGRLQASERFIAWLVWIVLALHITGVLPELLHLLDDLGFSLGRQRISLLLLIEGMLSIVVTLVLVLWLGSLLEVRIMNAQGLDLNLRVLATKFLRAGLLVVAVLIALPAVGIDVTVLSVFGGALGVGLGFGLQKIASNYVSGFIILLDKSIHLGDIITVDNRYGTVTSLTARYTVLKGLDGTEAIIPNETLITSSVVNHSYSDRKIRVGVPVQVSYASPLETAMRIMLEAGVAHPRVITDPPPKVLLKEFADNGINLELAVWITDPEEGMSSLRSDINLQIWHQFQQEGVEIPFPRRDIRLVDQPAQT